MILLNPFLATKLVDVHLPKWILFNFLNIDNSLTVQILVEFLIETNTSMIGPANHTQNQIKEETERYMQSGRT